MNITIRKFNLNDAETTFEYSGDFENTYYMLRNIDKSINETKEYIAKCISEYEAERPSYYSFAVECDGAHIGEVFAYLENDTADIGWLINKKYWGRSCATKAALLWLDYLKDNLGIHHIVSYCDERNVPSRRVMEHIGLEYICENGDRVYDKDIGHAVELKYAKELYYTKKL